MQDFYDLIDAAAEQEPLPEKSKSISSEISNSQLSVESAPVMENDNNSGSEAAPKKIRVSKEPNSDSVSQTKTQLLNLKCQADSLWVEALDQEGFCDDDETSLLDKPFTMYQECYPLLKQLRDDYTNDPVTYYYALKVVATAHYDLGHYVVGKQCFQEAIKLAYQYAEIIAANEVGLPEVIVNIRHNIALCDAYRQLFGTLDDEDIVAAAENPDLNSALSNIIGHLLLERPEKQHGPLSKNLTTLLIDIYQNSLGNDQPYIAQELNSRDAAMLYWIIQDVLTAEQITHLIVNAKNNDKAFKNIRDFTMVIQPALTENQLQLIGSYCVPETAVDKLIEQVNNKIVTFRKGGYFDKLNLKPHQVKTFEAWENHLKLGRNVGTFVKATGTGKTRDFLSFVLATVDPKFKVLILVPSKTLMYQTKDRLLELSQQIGKDLSVSVLDNPKAKSTDIDITTISLFNLEMKKSNKQRRLKIDSYKMIIRDEAHIGLNKNQKSNVEELAQSKIVLACTATPEYNTNRPIDGLKSLSQCYGETSQFFNYPLAQGIEEKQLSPVHVCLVTTDTGLRPERSTYKTKSGVTSKEISEKEAARLINHEKLNKVAIEIYMNCRHPDTGQTIFGRQAVFFCAGIPHAKDMANAINKHLSDHPRFKQFNVIPAAYISGELDNAKQRAILNDFREGKIAVLCGSDILITGIDVPDIMSIFNLRPTRSNVLALQRFGRSIRLSEKYPNKVALVFEFNWIMDNQVFVMGFLNDQHRLGEIKQTYEHRERVNHFRRDDILAEDRIQGTSPWELNWDGIIRQQAVGVRRKDIGHVPSVAAQQGAIIEHIAATSIPTATQQVRHVNRPPALTFFPPALPLQSAMPNPTNVLAVENDANNAGTQLINMDIDPEFLLFGQPIEDFTNDNDLWNTFDKLF